MSMRKHIVFSERKGDELEITIKDAMTLCQIQFT